MGEALKRDDVRKRQNTYSVKVSESKRVFMFGNRIKLLSESVPLNIVEAFVRSNYHVGG